MLANFGAAGKVMSYTLLDKSSNQLLIQSGGDTTLRGALAGPFAGTSVLGNTTLGGVVGASNTMMTNAIYGEDESVRNSILYGFGLSGLGTDGAEFTKLHRLDQSKRP